MKIKGIALRTVEEQIQGGDHEVIDPRLIENLPAEVPLSIDFAERIGVARVSLVNGRLEVEADISPDYLFANTLAVGVVKYPNNPIPELYEVSLTDKGNQDKGVPPYKVVE